MQPLKASEDETEQLSRLEREALEKITEPQVEVTKEVSMSVCWSVCVCERKRERGAMIAPRI